MEVCAEPSEFVAGSHALQGAAATRALTVLAAKNRNRGTRKNFLQRIVSFPSPIRGAGRSKLFESLPERSELLSQIRNLPAKSRNFNFQTRDAFAVGASVRDFRFGFRRHSVGLHVAG
jgi:hypothetical protein